MVKNTFLIIVLCMQLVLVSNAQLLNETFSSSFPPAGWSRFLNNAASIPSFNNWTSVTVNFPPATPDYAAFASGQGPGSVNVSEKYLVSPLLKPQPGSDTLFFKLKRAGTPVPLYANYIIKVSTASNNTVSDFVTVATFTEGFTSNITTTFQTLAVDLGAYHNQNIYVAFVWSGNGDNGCYLDDVTGIPLSTVLPIQLTSFTAARQNNEVQIKWKTASPALQSTFVLQHSRDGQNWNNTAQFDRFLDEYTFLHKSPVTGANYYRLMQKERNGQVTYSIIKVVNFYKNDKATIYPNPAFGKTLSLDMGYTPSAAVTYAISDMQGKIILKGRLFTQQNKISITSLNKGSYMLLIQDKQPIQFSVIE